jgi:prophage regulatory protein
MSVVAPLRLIRGNVVRDRFSRGSPNTIRAFVARGLLTHPIKLSPGPTSPSMWPEHEVDAVVQARVAGKTDDEIRALVRELEAKRKGVA